MEKDEFFKLVSQLLNKCPMWTAKIVRADVDSIFAALAPNGKLDIDEVRRVLQPWKKEAGRPAAGKDKQDAAQQPASKSPSPKKTARVAPMVPDPEPQLEEEDASESFNARASVGSRWSQASVESESAWSPRAS